jgi:sulfite exporter TauE/SafE
VTALIAAVFFASVLGSLHCAGMCGAFVAIACGRTESSFRKACAMQCAYHGGRLITYTALGVAAGFAGQMMNLAGALAGIKPFAAMLAGATMILFALITLAKIYGFDFAKLHPPAFMSRWLARGHRASMNHPPFVRALLIGLLTTLLPCGWLYAFVVTSAGTGSPLLGGVTMLFFWLGTLPVLVTIGAGVQKLTGSFGAKMPVLTCLVLLAVGMWTLLGRSFINPVALADRVNASQHHVPDHQEKPACCESK